MLNGKKIVVIMPAYNAERTLLATWEGVMAQGIVDHVVVVDDDSSDRTRELAQGLESTTFAAHPHNLGYGGNQKTCYELALEQGADVVVMVHPDGQYTPRLIMPMAHLVAEGLYSCALGSRILGGYARVGGMPAWRFVANRILSAIENLLMGSKLSELHTGYRAYSRELLERIPWHLNSDDFAFDNQILAQIIWFGYGIGEVSCPTSYPADGSSISFRRAVTYGFHCLWTAASFRLAKLHLIRPPRFSESPPEPAPSEAAAFDATLERD